MKRIKNATGCSMGCGALSPEMTLRNTHIDRWVGWVLKSKIRKDTKRRLLVIGHDREGVVYAITNSGVQLTLLAGDVIHFFKRIA